MKLKKNFQRILIFATTIVFLTGVGFIVYEWYNTDQIVNGGDIPVIVSQTTTNSALTTNKPEGPQIIPTEYIIKPFKVEAKVARSFFNVNDPIEAQANSLTYFEGTYRPNQGVDYTFNNQNFDCIAVVSGTIDDILSDDIMGKTVIIKSGNMRFIYQSVQDITVNKGDKVTQGQVIAKAGQNIYDKDLNVHLHFVVEKDNRVYNAEDIYNKAKDQIN